MLKKKKNNLERDTNDKKEKFESYEKNKISILSVYESKEKNAEVINNDYKEKNLKYNQIEVNMLLID